MKNGNCSPAQHPAQPVLCALLDTLLRAVLTLGGLPQCKSVEKWSLALVLSVVKLSSSKAFCYSDTGSLHGSAWPVCLSPSAALAALRLEAVGDALVWLCSTKQPYSWQILLPWTSPVCGLLAKSFLCHILLPQEGMLRGHPLSSPTPQWLLKAV